MRFLIHAIPEREENIAKLMAAHALSPLKDVEMLIYNDQEHEGNLPAYIESIKWLVKRTDIGGHELIWHLQDDILLLPNFWDRVKTYGKQYEESLSSKDGSSYIYCGFTSNADYVDGRGWKATGEVVPEAMFYSFPCIGIPLWLSGMFVNWIVFDHHTTEETTWINTGKFDDSLWQHFICQEWDRITRDGPVKIINLPKCLVDHRDDLCGGSVVNPTANSMDRRARLK